MTEQGQPSTFNTRSDQAALLLKQDLSQRHGIEIPPSPVAVNPDGSLPAPPPPEGSYARMDYDRQQAQLRAEQQAAAQHAQANLGQPTPQQVVGHQPPAGTPNQQSDGSQAPPLAGGQPQAAVPGDQSPAPQISESANARIQQLIGELRERDHQIANLAGSQGEVEQLKEQVQGLLTERKTFLEQHMDELDPEQRAMILAEARTRELLEQNNRALMEMLQPQLSTLQQQSQMTEMERVAAKFPGFDMVNHPPLIDMLRAKSPALTYEQAFKVVAEGDEAVTREHASAVAVPPVVSAGDGPVLPRYMPEPTPDPNAALIDFQQRTNKLLASSDHVEQRQGMKQLDAAIAERLRGASYDGKPSVFD